MRIPKIVTFILIFFGIILVIGYFYWVYPFWGFPFNAQRHTNPPITPPWALECWLWEDDIGTADRVDELLAGYKEHDIPVRAIILDSPWSTRYNDFHVDTTRYPKPAQWFKKLQDDGYRVVLWMTCMVDKVNEDTAIRNSQDWYEQARRNGFLAGNGYLWNWWKGVGGFIDYTNPDAMKWWHGMQQEVFDLGIDGWKLDGTSTFFSSKLGSLILPYQRTYKGVMTTREYMDHYYRDEYYYGLTQNPEFVTLARSIDMPWAHPEGFAPLDAAPVTWVGDQKHTWKSGEMISGDATPDKDLMRKVNQGIEEAIRYILQSAKIGYCVIGSDVGGYSGSTIPPRLYIRWAEFSTFCGLFMNGGHGERALWKRSQQELEIIRKFSWLHTELVPYMYSHVVMCHNGGKPLQRPVKGKYQYLFGDDFLVAPIYEDTLSRTVVFPPGEWYYFFNDHDIIEGPLTMTRDYPLDEFPVYVRKGAIIPMNITRPYTGIGDESYAGYLTFLIYPDKKGQFTVNHPDKSGQTTIVVEKGKSALNITLEGVKKPHILKIRLFQKPTRVILDERQLIYGRDWQYDADEEKLIIRTQHYKLGNYKILLS